MIFNQTPVTPQQNTWMSILREKGASPLFGPSDVSSVLGQSPEYAPDFATALPSLTAETPLDPQLYKSLAQPQADFRRGQEANLMGLAGMKPPELESGVPTQHMLGKALFGALLARMLGDKKGRAAAGILGGLTQSAQMGADARNKNRMMAFDQQGREFETEARIMGAKADREERRRERQEELGLRREEMSLKRQWELDDEKEAREFQKWNIAQNQDFQRQIAKEAREDKAQTEREKSAWKTLNDPKSTTVSRATALDMLAQEGIQVPPERRLEYLKSTYYEDNVRSQITTREDRQKLARDRFEKLSADQKARIAQAAVRLQQSWARIADSRNRTQIMGAALGARVANDEFNNALKNYDRVMKGIGLSKDMLSILGGFGDVLESELGGVPAPEYARPFLPDFLQNVTVKPDAPGNPLSGPMAKPPGRPHSRPHPHAPPHDGWTVTIKR